MAIIHEVVVGNIGTVYRGTDNVKAARAFADYAEQSAGLAGARCYGEEVTWFADGEIAESAGGQFYGAHLINEDTGEINPDAAIDLDRITEGWDHV